MTDWRSWSENLAQVDWMQFLSTKHGDSNRNNFGKRKDLTIYIVTKDFHLKDSIKIQYAKQKTFKKDKKTKYDAEALVAYGDSL